MRRPRTTVFSSLVFSTKVFLTRILTNMIRWRRRTLSTVVWFPALLMQHVSTTQGSMERCFGIFACHHHVPCSRHGSLLWRSTCSQLWARTWTCNRPHSPFDVLNCTFALVVLQNKLDCSESQASALFCYFAVLEFYSRTQRCDTRRLQLPYVYCISLLAMWGKGSWKCCCEHIVVDVKHTRRPSVPAFYPCDHAACFLIIRETFQWLSVLIIRRAPTCVLWLKRIVSRRADFPSWVITPGEVRSWRNEFESNFKLITQHFALRHIVSFNLSLHVEATQKLASLYPHTALTWH